MKRSGPGGLTPAAAVIRHARLRAAWDFLCHSGRLLEGAPVVNAARTVSRRRKSPRPQIAVHCRIVRNAGACWKIRPISRRKLCRAGIRQPARPGLSQTPPCTVYRSSNGRNCYGKSGSVHCRDTARRQRQPRQGRGNSTHMTAHTQTKRRRLCINFPHKHNIVIRIIKIFTNV